MTTTNGPRPAMPMAAKLAAAIAAATCPTRSRTCASTPRTSITDTDGKGASSARVTLPSAPGGRSIVAARLCGASASVFGEKTSTKLKPSVSHWIVRNEATRAVRSTPSRLTVNGSPSLRSSACASRSSTDTSGGPA